MLKQPDLEAGRYDIAESIFGNETNFVGRVFLRMLI